MFNFYEKFLIKHVYKSPVASVDDVKIIYQDVVIAWGRIDKYLRGKDAIKGGETSANIIKIFNYLISDDVPSIYKGFFNEIIDFDEKQVIEHEKKHIKNAVLNNYIAHKITSSYELALQAGLEEVSAFSAGHLLGAAPKSLGEAFDVFFESLGNVMEVPDYLHEHSCLMNFNYLKYDTKKKLNAMIAQKQVNYSNQFYKIIDYFLTFGDYHIIDVNNHMPHKVQKRFEVFKGIYENSVREKLKVLLQNLK